MRTYRKAAGSWVLMGNIKNLSRPKPRDEADISTRASFPWKATKAGFRDWSSDWDMNYDEEDPDFLALKAADDAGEPVELAFSANDIEEIGTIYFHVPVAEIFKFDIDEQLTEGASVAVTVKNASPSNPPRWRTVGDESGSGSGA